MVKKHCKIQQNQAFGARHLCFTMVWALFAHGPRIFFFFEPTFLPWGGVAIHVGKDPDNRESFGESPRQSLAEFLGESCREYPREFS